MTTLLSILKLVAVLVAALLIGNWFLAEVRSGPCKTQTMVSAIFIHSGRVDYSGIAAS